MLAGPPAGRTGNGMATLTCGKIRKKPIHHSSPSFYILTGICRRPCVSNQATRAPLTNRRVCSPYAISWSKSPVASSYEIFRRSEGQKLFNLKIEGKWTKPLKNSVDCTIKISISLLNTERVSQQKSPKKLPKIGQRPILPHRGKAYFGNCPIMPIKTQVFDTTAKAGHV